MTANALPIYYWMFCVENFNVTPNNCFLGVIKKYDINTIFLSQHDNNIKFSQKNFNYSHLLYKYIFFVFLIKNLIFN